MKLFCLGSKEIVLNVSRFVSNRNCLQGLLACPSNLRALSISGVSILIWDWPFRGVEKIVYIQGILAGSGILKALLVRCSVHIAGGRDRTSMAVGKAPAAASYQRDEVGEPKWVMAGNSVLHRP